MGGYLNIYREEPGIILIHPDNAARAFSPDIPFSDPVSYYRKIIIYFRFWH